MIAVSNIWEKSWKETLLPEMFVEIACMVTEPGLQDDASSSGNYPEDFSDPGQVVSILDKNSEAYTTLEYGCWGLDGSYSYFDGTPVDPGYVDTNFSDSTGSLDVSQYPTVTIDFTMRHDASIPGVMITWSEVFGAWAEDFRVTARSAAGIVAQTTVVGNTSPVSVVEMDIAGYSSIKIEILKWSHPLQKPRCLSVVLGIRNVYTKKDLLGYDHRQSADLLTAALPNNEIVFKLRNDDARWNPDNPTGLERYLIERQKVDIRYGMDTGGKTEWIPGGTFWLSEWSTPSNGLEAVFTARDAIEFMGAIYTGPRSGTLYDIAIAALTQAELPVLEDGSQRYVVSESLKDITTDFTEDDGDYLVSEILQMVAHAGGCVFHQDRVGVIHIEPWKMVYSNYLIEPGISYSHPEYTINKPLKSISVGYGGDKDRAVVDVSTRGEVQTVDNPLVMTEADALRVGETAKVILENRKVISGDFRADLRMDALDCVIVGSKYSSNIIGVTEVSYSTTGGAFRGKYTGRVVSINLSESKAYSNEFYAGEVW